MLNHIVIMGRLTRDPELRRTQSGVSVTTINGGDITISGGNGAEGDGIDSNGAIVVNGGSLYASANPQTGDGGIDADLGIYLNGGTVITIHPDGRSALRRGRPAMSSMSSTVV